LKARSKERAFFVRQNFLDFLRLFAYNISGGKNMAEIAIKLPQKNIEEFCRKWKISEMSLFGSVLSNNFRSDSDIDVLVNFEDNASWSLFDFVDMIDELKIIFGRKVDLVEKDTLKNPFRKQSILASNKVIYAA
jgi:predicted nucleotidyltransferase